MIHPNMQSAAHRSGGLVQQILESVHIVGHLRDLACELTVKQDFINPSDTPIEAVYTFPLPYGAVLLDLTVKIGQRTLRGAVFAKQQAERRYEEAITEGDGAIMLEQSDDGICTVNLGNLLPGEQATLTYQYAYLLVWQQDTVKFRLPTTIAPRYGDPIAAGYQPHQVPVTNQLTENRFGLQLKVEGLLANALIDSPSHKISLHRKDHVTDIILSDQAAFMDRDFVLDLKLTASAKASGQLAWDETGQCHTALVSFYPTIPGKELPSLCLKIVVDCSGSMAGSSILQAQAGLRRILDNIRAQDTFNIVLFGSHHHAYFPKCVAAEGRNLRYARQAIDQLSADMGGTEMALALDFTYGLKDTGQRPTNVLLITDGEISAHHDVIQRAVKSGQRLFTVGVGAAVAEEFVRGIAENTGGACELVTPNENMADAIYRQFRRMFQPCVARVSIEWPQRPSWQAPETINTLFAGDTLHVQAGFSQAPVGEARLSLHLQDDSELYQTITLQPSPSQWSALPRLAAARRIDQLNPESFATAEKMAVDYQLITRQTNFLILDIREADQKAQDLPQLAQVPQMLAAGWGGNGMIAGMPGDGADCSLLFSQAETEVPFHDYFQFAEINVPKASDTYQDIGNLQACFEHHQPADLITIISLALDEKLAILKLMADAGEDWLGIFLKEVFPTLDAALQVYFRDLVQSGEWTEEELAAAILFIMAEQNGWHPSGEVLKTVFSTAQRWPTLVHFVRQGPILALELVADHRNLGVFRACKHKDEVKIGTSFSRVKFDAHSAFRLIRKLF